MLLLCLTSAISKEAKENKNELEIEKVISLIGEGDTNSLAKLYEETKTAVYGFALSILKNRFDAEDVLQNTYVQIYRSAKTYKSMGKPMAWILRIARNLAYMKIRESKASEEVVDWGFSEVENADSKMLLQEAVKILSQEELQIVLLHAVSGFKHREIAKDLNLPIATVLSKYNRSIKKLKKLFTEGEYAYE